MGRRKDKLSHGAFLLLTSHHAAVWCIQRCFDSRTLQDFVQFA
jgi:hypothetical protein